MERLIITLHAGILVEALRREACYIILMYFTRNLLSEINHLSATKAQMHMYMYLKVCFEILLAILSEKILFLPLHMFHAVCSQYTPLPTRTTSQHPAPSRHPTSFPHFSSLLKAMIVKRLPSHKRD